MQKRRGPGHPRFLVFPFLPKKKEEEGGTGPEPRGRAPSNERGKKKKKGRGEISIFYAQGSSFFQREGKNFSEKRKKGKRKQPEAEGI